MEKTWFFVEIVLPRAGAELSGYNPRYGYACSIRV